MGSVRAIWAAQDEFALDGDEGKSVELKREFAGGQERVVCNASLSIATEELGLTDAEVARIKAAIETWYSNFATADRPWLEPLVELIFSPEAKP